MIVLEKVSREFKAEKILKEVDLVIKPSEITSIVAPNGVGKTTLLCIIANVIFPTTGSIFFKNDFSKRDVFLILSGERNLYMKNTVYENISYFCTLRGLKRKEIEENIEKHADKMPLYAKIKNKLCEELSFGQKRLVIIFAAFVAGARCIIMDEPSEGLDYAHLEMIEKMLSIGKKDKIILITSHNYEFVSKIADRNIFLKSGEIAHKTGQIDQDQLLEIYKKLYGEGGIE